jgi:hypothetical protein
VRWLVAGFGIAALLLAGCTSGPFGTVAGTFQEETGPPGEAKPWPLFGVVRFTDATGQTVSVTVGASGKFSVRLAPGIYRVEGFSSQMGLVDPHSNISQPPCDMPKLDTRVQAEKTDQVTVTCYGP